MLADGRQVDVTVPGGCSPGTTIQIDVPGVVVPQSGVMLSRVPDEGGLPPPVPLAKHDSVYYIGEEMLIDNGKIKLVHGAVGKITSMKSESRRVGKDGLTVKFEGIKDGCGCYPHELSRTPPGVVVPQFGVTAPPWHNPMPAIISPTPAPTIISGGGPAANLGAPPQTTVSHQTVNVNVSGGKGGGSIMEEVHPVLHVCCCYCAITPSVQMTTSSQCCCCNTLTGCCREAAEGCICWEFKEWCTCTGCTCCKCVCTCCCCAWAGAFPCQKNIPCRLTVLYLTCCPPCGCCEKVDHGAALHGIQKAGGAPPSPIEMGR
jgi:hypothetical protein